MTLSASDKARKKRILEGLRGRPLEQAVTDPVLRPDLEAEADSTVEKKIITRDLLAITDAARRARQTGPSLSLFFSSADVILVPGFLASQLEDVTGGNGLIWIDPQLILDASELNALKLAPTADTDATPGVSVSPDGAIPVIYAGLRAVLEASRYHVIEFAFDWRKHVDVSANLLADIIRDRANNRPRPLHLVAHSQGSLIARRALQLLGPTLGRQLVDSLVLLGPATAGSFSAVFGIAGTHELLDQVQRFGVEPPPGFDAVLQSMSGLYQLLPWRTEPVDGTDVDKAIEWVRANFPPPQSPANVPVGFRNPAAWKSGVDAGRLSGLAGWAAGIDASYLNDRTTIILGDQPTVGGAMYDAANKLVPDPAFTTTGDGTVPESMARIPGVTRLFKAAGAEHTMLPATRAVIAAVRDILAGRTPALDRAPGLAAPKPHAPLRLGTPPTPDDFFRVEKRPVSAPSAGGATVSELPAAVFAPTPGSAQIAEVSPPVARRLKVFSFDPLFGTDVENLGVAQLTVELPWEFCDGCRLQPGPVGEYVEVVDFDSTARCFYPPVDLNHPHLLAQDGIPISEGDPRFHQQMAYAVVMNTIRQFEIALGRTAQWAPNLPRNQYGEVEIPPGHRPEDEYVGRLRVYPHAMREQNAYYSPEKKALLFGYFPADGPDVGRNLPGGMVFSCLSYDVLAHETTHALLDGLHRYFTQPSNMDVFAFHEAFADIVALLQHFSHPEVLRHQIAKVQGNLEGESSLGALAAQFGEATGQRGALRAYLGKKSKPADRDAIRKETEPHKRGAILVAAVFQAFVGIYENRVKDLRRIATGGSGLLPPGDLHPDMVNRLADEAAKSARHLLRMCIRALDYAPPVDLTFGDYLRALVTADYELVRNDDLGYRVSIVSAFRDWGIYPTGVRSLSVDSLLWRQPERRVLFKLREFFQARPFDDWSLSSDRRSTYLLMNEHNKSFHEWLGDPEHLPLDRAESLGLCLDPATAPGGIHRDANGKPVFQVHMFRPCRRIGPDGQELTEVVVEVIQRRAAYFDEKKQAAVDAGGTDWSAPANRPDFYHRGGCTLVLDPKTGSVRYFVSKPIRTRLDERLIQERAFRQNQFQGGAAAFLDPREVNNPFAGLHTCHSGGKCDGEEAPARTSEKDS